MAAKKRHVGTIIYAIYAVSKLIAGIYLNSLCFFAIGIYFLLLLGIKHGILRDEETSAAEVKAVMEEYELRACHKAGAELLFLGIVMAVIVMQAVLRGMESQYRYPELLMYGNAMFTFLFFADAIARLVRNRKNKNPMIFASGMVNLQAALMSVLTLQIDMVYVFGDFGRGDDMSSISMNGATGGIVCIITIIIAVYMTIYEGENDLTWTRNKSEKIEYSQKVTASLTAALVLLGITVALTSTQVLNSSDDFLMKLIASEEFALTVPIWLESLMYGMCIFFSYILINYHEKRLSTIINSVVLAATIISILFFILSGYHFQLLAMIISMLLAFVFLVIQELILSRLKNRHIEGALNLYVDANIVEELAYVPQKDMAGTIKRKNIAVLFVDIRGFTTMSEQMEPEEIVEILNDYLSVIADVIQRWGGTLDKFIGDAAMAVFNSPRDQEDYVYMAVCAAREIVERGRNMKRVVNYGIGINCGEAVIGNIGSRTHMDFTAIGDTVNTASRLEGQARAGQILISETVKEAIGDRFEVRFAGELKLKGKSRMVKAYEVTGG